MKRSPHDSAKLSTMTPMHDSRSDLRELQRRAQERDGPQTLQRLLTGNQLILLGIGGIIGAGIFVATGAVAAHNTGPAIVFSFLIAALACLCSGLCYAEFAAMCPVSGSAYSYVYASFGRAAAWLVGWCLLLEYLVGAANVAVGWSAYLRALLNSLGMQLSERIASPPLALSPMHGLTSTGSIINLPAVLLLLVLSASLLRGLRLSVRMNAALVAIKLTVIALFIVCGVWFVDTGHWRPFLPPNTGAFGAFGWSGVLRGAGVIFYAYLGFDIVSTAGRETCNPQRDLPRAIIGSLAICTGLYIMFSLVLTGLAPYTALAAPNPASVALDYAGPRLYFLKVAVEFGAVVGLTSVVLVLLYGQTRVLYAMARDGVIPAWLGHVGAHSHVPDRAVLACALVTTSAAAFLPTELLGELISIGTLMAFMFVCAGVLVLRVLRPDLQRPFRTPFAPFVCTSGVLICGYLMSALPNATWLRFLAWIALGALIYVCYGMRSRPAPKSGDR
jgi:basic amino acid/polyamine antiporter, APA family